LNNGRKMPVLGIGTFTGFVADKPMTTSEAVTFALKIGYRHIDCAYAHNNEAEISIAIKNAYNNLGIKREEIFVATKLWNEFHKPEDVEPALRQSLRNLGLDYLDLYLMHWPFAFEKQHQTDILHPVDFTHKFVYDTQTHFTETWGAMEALVHKGLVKSIGVSNFNEDQLQMLINNCTVKPTVNQIECHPYLNQHRLMAFCNANNIRITAYSPLGCKDRLWTSPLDDQPLLEHTTLRGIAKKHKKSIAQILLRWQIQREVAVVPRMRTPEHISENFLLWDWTLSENDMLEIHDLNRDNRLYLPLIEGQPWCSDHPHYPFKINSI